MSSYLKTIFHLEDGTPGMQLAPGFSRVLAPHYGMPSDLVTGMSRYDLVAIRNTWS